MSFRPWVEALECRITPSVNADFNGDGFGDLAIGVPRAASDVFAAGAVHVVYGSAGGLSVDAALDAQIWTQDDIGLSESAQGDQFGATLAAGDFDGDGFGDLAIGVPHKDVQGVVDCGAVMLLFGSPTGLHAEGRPVITQGGLTGDLGDNRAFDFFGYSLAAGNFNGDQFDDLAIGAPNANTTADNTGLVYVVPGSATGLDFTSATRLHQSQIGDDEEANDGFGTVLGVGNFNGDAYDDLAVGAPNEKVGTVAFAGAVDVLLGGPAGLQVTGAQIWRQGAGGIKDSAENSDHFGASLAAGDINHDGKSDLAIGVPGEDLGTISNGGAVQVIYSGASGLISIGNQFWTQNSYGIADRAEANDAFGTNVALADLSGDGRADLVVGVPHEGFGTTKTNVGAVHIIYASVSGRLTAAWSQFWFQGVILSGFLTKNQNFGAALAIGDFNGDSRPDLVIGTPGDIGVLGAVHVLYGSSKRLTGINAQYWTQGQLGVEATPGELFGFALAGGFPTSRS